ncbi:hypothetical protein MMC21_001996 [Puttea exsequens]|nr:hypothetical protein [Puttea exsequens]
MSFEYRQSTPDDVVGKVLRRAEVAKIARKLQDRLALASYKTQHGQEALSFNDVEARLEKTIQRKRATSSVGTSSTVSSSSSDRPFFSGGIASSPLSAPFSSDGTRCSTKTKASRKRDIYQATSTATELASKPSKRVRSQSMAPPLFESSRTSWKSTHNLPESSPVYRQDGHFSTSHGPTISFASEVSTIPASPPFGRVSDEESNDLPAHSFSVDSNFHSSPPRTPPPTRSRSARHRNGNEAGEEGADLLLYLATSPSPANPRNKSSQIYSPSTPPSNLALPSSMMGTSGLAGFNTPGQQFNFADFVNITPSPAQGAFGNRTPGLARTPLAAKEARRRLNFEALVPPSGSPNFSNIGRGSMNKDSGLGMELGGELVS